MAVPDSDPPPPQLTSSAPARLELFGIRGRQEPAMAVAEEPKLPAPTSHSSSNTGRSRSTSLTIIFTPPCSISQPQFSPEHQPLFRAACRLSFPRSSIWQSASLADRPMEPSWSIRNSFGRPDCPNTNKRGRQSPDHHDDALAVKKSRIAQDGPVGEP